MTNVIILIRKKVKGLRNDPEKAKRFFIYGHPQDHIQVNNAYNRCRDFIHYIMKEVIEKNVSSIKNEFNLE